MKLDLHLHTNHSFDGRVDVETLLKSAEEAGLDAVAITDHDTMSAVGLAGKISSRVTIIPGMEITTEGGMHLIGLFLTDEIVSRDIDEVIDEIHQQGGLVLIPHPYRPGSGLMDIREEQGKISGEQAAHILSRADLIEAFNYRCRPEKLVNTDRFLSFYPDLARTAGSDAHFAHEIGKACVDLENVKSNSLDDIKDALLYSPRLLRYEAYTEMGESEAKTAVIKGRRKSLILKTRDLIPRYVRKSIKSIYRKSVEMLQPVKKDKITSGPK